MRSARSPRQKHIVLTSHPGQLGQQLLPICWGHADPAERGPIIVSLDPFGALDNNLFAALRAEGYDIRPSIAITRAHINIPELQEAFSQDRLPVDGKILNERGDLVVTKAAVEPTWY